MYLRRYKAEVCVCVWGGHYSSCCLLQAQAAHFDTEQKFPVKIATPGLYPSAPPLPFHLDQPYNQSFSIKGKFCMLSSFIFC